MKFLVDAHLPPALCALLQAAGHDARHTRDLPARSATTDTNINALCAAEDRVLITKDSDFYYSHTLHGRPAKLLLVRTGNLRARELQDLCQTHLAEIVHALEHNSFVELDRKQIILR